MPNPPVLPDYLVEDEDVAAMPDFLEEVGGGMDSPLPEYLSEVSEDGTELPDFLEPVEESDTPIQPAPVTLSDADKAQIANIQLDPQERIDLLNKYPDDVFDPEKMQQNLLVETTTKRAQAYGDATGDYSILDDLGRDVAIGLNRFGQLLGRGLQWAGAEYSGKKMEDFYKEAEAEDVAGQSPEHRAAQEKRFLSDKEGEFFGDAWTSPRKVASAVLQSAPSMAVGMGGGMAVAKGLMQAGMSSGMAGIIGGAVGEGSVAGAEAAKTAQDVVRQAPEELLVQTPEYQEAYKSLPLKMPVSERKAQAREMVASQAAKQTGLFVGGSTAVLGGPSGHFMGKLIGGEGGKRLASSVGKGMLLEGLQEAPQSAVEQGAVNRLKQKFQDPNTGLLDDVGEAAVEGGITGAVMGAPFTGLAHQAGKAGAGQELPPAENKDVNPNRVVSPTGPDGVPDLYAGLRQAAAGAQQETPAVSESEGQLSGNSEQFTDFPQTPEDVGRLPEFLEPVEEQLSSDSLQLDSRTETEWNTPQTSGLHEKYADRNADISHITDRQAINEAALRDIRDDAARERISSLTRDRLLGDHGVVPFREIDDAMREMDREGIPYTYERTDGGNLGGLNAHHGDRHDAADEDIRKVWGEVLAEEVRRYGGIMGRDQGDEFKIVWPNLSVDEVTEIRADIEQQVRKRADALGLGAVTHPKAGYNNMPMGALYTSYGLVEGRPGQYRDVDRAADELQASMKRVQVLEKARELGYNYNQETEQYEPRSIEQTSGPGRADYEGIPGEVGSVQESEDSGVRVEGAQDTGRNEPAEDRTADKDQAVDFSEDISGDKDSGTRYMLSKQKTEEKTDTPEFKRWFGKSKVVDESGKPLVVYHKTKGDFESFEDISSKGEGFHFGTSGQANMRAAGREERVLPVYLNIQKVIRKKDQPYGWKKAVKAAKSKRFDGIIYLNRYEGVPQERFQELYAKGYTQEKLDSISDSQFRKLVPEARDSYIVFDPTQIKSVFNRGTFDPTDPRIRYMFAGQKAATADLDALERARAMEKDGADNEAIRQETGWFRGMDEKWRFEIDDSGSNLHPLVESGQVDRWNLDDGINAAETLKGSNIFSEYPELANIKTSGQIGELEKLNSVLAGGDWSKRGEYADGEIAARGDTTDDYKSTFLHELQHAVQEREGFARGGSLQGMAKLRHKGSNEIKQLNRELSFFAHEMEKVDKGSDRYNMMKEQYEALLNKRSSLVDAINGEPYDLYRRLAGEIEARDVQKRMNMTTEERKATPPDLRPDAIVRFNNKGPAASLSTSSEIQTHVDGLSKSWKNAPDIRVVQDESQLPGEVYQDIRRMGGFGSVRGVYHQGKVYLVANNLSSKEEVAETVFHEALRHHGMRLVLGDKYDSFMKNAALNTKVREAMKILAEQYKLDMKDPADRVALADEAIAHLADRGWTGSLWNRIVAAFRKFLRSIGLKLKISDSEIRNLISRSSWAVRNGKRKPQYMFMESDIRERIMLRIEEIIDDLMGQGYNFADIARIATLQVKKEIQQEQEAGKVGTDITIPRDFTAQEFKEWFKDSVAVTEDGSPRVWFHGSPSGEITELRRGAGDLGIHLGTPGQAEAAFKNKAANTGRAGTPAVYPVYVSVQNPLRLPDGQWDVERVALRLLQENVGSPKVLGDLIERWRNYDPNSKTEDMQDELRDMLEAEGYDGIVYSNVYESNTETGLHDTADSLMVFRPEQIKSVFNVGSWDGSNPDIRYLQKESVQTEVEKGEQLRQKFIDEIFRLIHEDSTGSAAFGLRITDEQPAKVGDILSASYPWDDGEHIEGADDLGGTSVIGIEAEASKEEIEEALNLSGPFRDFIPYRTGSSGYWGDQVLLVRGDRYSRGMDEGEYVIVDPEVIGAWSYPKMNGLVGEGQTLYSRNLTPAQEAALSKIGQPNKPLTERVKDWYANARSQGMAHMRQGLVDQYHSFNLLDKEFKKETGFDEYEGQSYTLARMANSLGDVMYSMLHHGAPKWSEGWVTTDGRDNGLIQIFKPLGADLDLFMAYRVGVRAEKLKAEDRENLFTDDDIQALLALRPEDAAEAQKWDDIWAEYSSFRKNTLDFAQAAGLIDPEKRKVWEDSDHLPFYRVMENDKRKRGPLKRRGLANQNSGIRRLKGGTDNIGDPYANIIHNMAHLTEAAIKNHAANVAVQKMEALGYAYKPKNQAEMRRIDADKAAQKLRRALEDDAAVRKLTDAEKDTVLSLFWSKPPKGENVVSVMQNGKKLYYEIEDPLLLSSLASVNSEHLNFTGLKTMRFLKRLLTAGVTLDPGFRAANLARDTFAAWGVSKGKGFTPVWDSLRGAVKVWNENDDMVEMMAAGGSFASGWSWGGDPEDTARRIKREMKAHRVDQESVLDTPKKVLGFVKKAWDQWERVGSASENAARVQMFANVRKNGGSLLEAAYESKDVMDFSLRGDWKAMQFLIQTVPFLGARVQSLYKMTRAGNRMAYWVKGGSLAMASMLLYLWNRDDDRFKELEEWDKDTYYHFWIGDEHFRYPKPFEYGAMFSTIPERALEYFLQGQDDKDSKLLIDRLAFMMEQTLSLNPMPQGFKQGVEVWANKNFFTGRPIEGMSLKREMPGYRRKPWTSETMSEIGKGLGVSPKKLEHFYRGIFGPVGMYVLSASDVLARQTADYPNPPATKLEESPVVSRFYKGSGPARNTKYATKFYDFIQEVDQLAATIKSLRESGSREQAQKIFELERDKIRYKKYLSSVRRQIIGINNQVNRIYLDNKKSPEVKRKELDRLQARKNRILKQAYERVSKDFR